MDKIYLVLNVEDPHEPFVINICSTEEKALELKNKYLDNYERNGEKDYPYIVVDEVSLDSENEILWDAYEGERELDD